MIRGPLAYLTHVRFRARTWCSRSTSWSTTRSTTTPAASSTPRVRSANRVLRHRARTHRSNIRMT